jgi:LysM repeat protein
MDKTKANKLIDKANNLKNATATELKLIFTRSPKTTVRDKGEFNIGTVARRGVKRKDKGRLETQDKGQSGEISPTKKVDDKTVVTRNKLGRLLNVSNKYKKTIGKNESRVAKRTRKKIIGRTVSGIAGASIANKIFGGKDSKDYKVKKGDTLSEVARDKGTTVGKIKDANPKVKNLNKITPGQTIKIPMPKVKNRKSVYQDLTKEEMKKIQMKKKAGGGLIDPPNIGASKLPEPVRNKMGFKKNGGKIVKRASGGLIGGGAALRGFGAVRKK